MPRVYVALDIETTGLDCERDAIMEALRMGRFYAATGVDVESVRCKGRRLEVVSIHADTITFMGVPGV